ncbi:hypothetical protein [Actinomadura sp. CNU-125]|uniref:hypothetical protein n=1 Tax=Actinomadura sp. CNU-125 TaxID=1904961 RepID=UPI001301651B|nr:hypothetical protein [Actinomadura sp. CNU-125]
MLRLLVVRYLRRRAIRQMGEAFDLADGRDARGAVRCHERATVLWRAVEVLRCP